MQADDAACAVQTPADSRTAAWSQSPAPSHADGVQSPPLWSSPPTPSEHRNHEARTVPAALRGWHLQLARRSACSAALGPRRRRRYVVLMVDISSYRRRRCSLPPLARHWLWGLRGEWETYEQRPWTGSRGGSGRSGHDGDGEPASCPGRRSASQGPVQGDVRLSERAANTLVRSRNCFIGAFVTSQHSVTHQFCRQCPPRQHSDWPPR